MAFYIWRFTVFVIGAKAGGLLYLLVLKQEVYCVYCYWNWRFTVIIDTETGGLLLLLVLKLEVYCIYWYWNWRFYCVYWYWNWRFTAFIGTETGGLLHLLVLKLEVCCIYWYWKCYKLYHSFGNTQRSMASNKRGIFQTGCAEITYLWLSWEFLVNIQNFNSNTQVTVHLWKQIQITRGHMLIFIPSMMNTLYLLVKSSTSFTFRTTLYILVYNILLVKSWWLRWWDIWRYTAHCWRHHSQMLSLKCSKIKKYYKIMISLESWNSLNLCILFISYGHWTINVGEIS